MLKPKFRAWHKESDSIQYIAAISELFFDSDSVCAVRLRHELGFEKLVTDMDRVKLMQWTGLQTSTGQDIYEGDILSINNDGEIDKGIVRFSSGMFWVCPVTLFDDCSLSEFAECPDFEVEIIGNIYENERT